MSMIPARKKAIARTKSKKSSTVMTWLTLTNKYKISNKGLESEREMTFEVKINRMAQF